MNFDLKKQFIVALVTSLTLGLAPFQEPHIIGKIKWVRGGAVGMKTMDWFDLLLHGSPWVYLFVLTVIFVFRKIKPQ